MAEKIIAGSDHGGFRLKQYLVEVLREWGYEVEDLGVFSEDSVDYPDVAEKVAHRVLEVPGSRGLLLCGTGIGVSIAANKVKGIRAAHVSDPYSASMAAAHNSANILTMGGRVVGPELARSILRAYLETPFEGGRHQRRVDKITALEHK